MAQLDYIAEKIREEVNAKKYEFDSFLLGVSLPASVFEQEDSIRARFKIRGRENIKKQFVNELRKKFAEITGKRLKHTVPDVTINVVIEGENVTSSSSSPPLPQPTISIKSSPLLLAGRYLKTQRGLQQKKEKCQICSADGCVSCGYTGASSPNNSIEAIIASRMLDITGGEKPKFSWLGSEDKDSLVLGKGRPFLMRILNPKLRSLKKDVKIKGNGVSAAIRPVKHQQLPSNFSARFITKTRIAIQAQQDLRSKNLAELLNVLENSEVTFKAKSKILRKKIYSLDVESVNDKEFVLTIIADGGLSIKQFVGGQEYSEPNISKIVGTKCECIVFDVLDINTIEDSFRGKGYQFN